MGVYRCTETGGGGGGGIIGTNAMWGGGGGGVLYSRQQCYLHTIQGGLGDW